MGFGPMVRCGVVTLALKIDNRYWERRREKKLFPRNAKSDSPDSASNFSEIESSDRFDGCDPGMKVMLTCVTVVFFCIEGAAAV